MNLESLERDAKAKFEKDGSHSTLMIIPELKTMVMIIYRNDEEKTFLRGKVADPG